MTAALSLSLSLFIRHAHTFLWVFHFNSQRIRRKQEVFGSYLETHQASSRRKFRSFTKTFLWCSAESKMAASLFRDRDQYNCSVCLDLMNDPVTIPCGHSYCRSCIKHYWDRDESRRARCPQCRQDFPKTPALNKNTMLAEILETLRNTTLQGSPPSPPAQTSAQPGEVECDFCTDVKLRAVRSCLECRAAYCETHLQPHYDFPALRKHKLVVAAEILTCPRHDRLLEAFCRTDNILICMSCVMDEHKGHDTVSSAAERDEKQVGHFIIIH